MRNEPPRYWETWEPSTSDLPAGLRELARYVSPEALNDVRWDDDLDPHRLVADREHRRPMAALLYERLARRPVAFWGDPWVPDATGQRIRHPWLLVNGQQQGTCLDFATTYAAMCLDSSIPPLIVLTLGQDGRGHAFVLLTPGRDPHPAVPVGEEGLAPGFDATSADGVLELGADSWRRLEAGLRTNALLPIDFARLAKEPVPELDVAAERAREHVCSAREAGDAVYLVDVAWLHEGGGVAPFHPPTGQAPIQRYVPGGRSPFEPYAGQRTILDELDGQSGTVVLHGESGTGKSTVARHLAFRTQFGAAWFLNASEPQALINSLCQASLAEDDPGLPVEDLVDREGFAEQARQRLLEAESDWLVVIDNADGDPAKLERWLPRPNPDRPKGVRQLVLVTTTNAAWSNLYDYPVNRLERVDEEEAAGQLPGPELVDLAGGLPLLFDSFGRLAAATGWNGARIAARGEERDDGESREVHAGAATLWVAAAEAIGADSEILAAAAAAAYLPPDDQPLAVHRAEPADGDSDRTTRRLAELGLVDVDSEAESLRMHRLVGAAIRDDLQRREPSVCDKVAQRIASDEEAVESYELLDDHGDLGTIENLESWLETINRRTKEADALLGVAMHGVAQLLELHGHTHRSGECFKRAERHVADDEKRRARGLHGQARTVNQHYRGDRVRLREALGWAGEAKALRERSDPPAFAASLAMEGLLEQKLADFSGDGETTSKLLQKALGTLEQAYDLLREQLEEKHGPARLRLDPELARRYFNLAGINVRLAQARPEEAKKHLDEAWKVYTFVEERRREIYSRSAIHPHVAACVIGRAYVHYFRAIFVPAGKEARTRLLRQATEATNDALKMRQAQEGSLDGAEVRKCVDFLLKVTVERRS